MEARDATFYDLIARGLPDISYQEFVDRYLAETQNGRKTDGFEWDPNMQIDFTYAQIQAELGIATMPTYVDIDSPGVYKSTDGFELSTGKIPRFKHGYAINEKILREEMIIAKRTGRYSTNLQMSIMQILFDNTQKLIMGNYNALTYQRDQMVSTGKFTLTADNNPSGIKGITFKANIPDENVTTLSGAQRWFVDSNGTEGTSSNPVKDLRDRGRALRRKGVVNFHWEVDSETFDMSINHGKVRTAVVANMYPLASTDQVAIIAATLDDNTIKATLERLIGAPIKVVDNIVAVEKFNKDKGEIDKKQIRSFAPNVWVLVPDGSLGSIKSVEPIVVPDPAARIAYFDGGRTVLKQWFITRTNTQYIESESTQLVVPDKPKYMLYLQIA